MNRREAIHVAKLMDMKFLLPCCKLVGRSDHGLAFALPHLRWMIKRIVQDDDLPDDIVFRWIGHIQCALILVLGVEPADLDAVNNRTDVPAEVVRLEDHR